MKTATSNYITDELVQKTLEITDDFVSQCHPRITGQNGAKLASELIKELYNQSCDNVSIEEFDVRPRSFLGLIRYAAFIFILSSVLVFYEMIYIATIGYLIAFFMILSQSFMYWEVFDPLFTRKSGYNVIGTIEPKGEAKQQIIISGHHDAPYVFHLLERMPRFYGPVMIMANLSVVISLVISIWWGINLIIFGEDPGNANTLSLILILAIIPVIPFIFFITNSVSPGAGDNMIASVITTQTAAVIKQIKDNNEDFMQNTRIKVLSFDSEEAGLRGARAFVKKNLQSLKSLPTYVFNMDSIYEIDNLKFLSKDLNSTVKLSEMLITMCKELAKKLGQEMDVIPMPWGAGSTDAAEFGRHGIETLSIIGLSTEFIRTTKHYHTNYDTVDKIEPAAVKFLYQLIFETCIALDEQVN